MKTGILLLSGAVNIFLVFRLWKQKPRRLRKYTPQYLKRLANNQEALRVSADNWLDHLRVKGII